MVRVIKEALDLGEGLRDLVLRRRVLGVEVRDLRVLRRRRLRLRLVEGLRDLEYCR